MENIFGPGFSWVETECGTIILNDNDRYISGEIRSGGYWESKLTETAALYLAPDSVIFDIGANIGTHTLFFSKQCPAGKIHAFEPHKEIFKQLLVNIVVNHRQNVELYNSAVGKAGTFYHLPSKLDDLKLNYPGNYGNISLTTNNREIANNTNLITVVEPDSQLAGIDKLDFVKIDVEGAELDVILSMRSLIRKFKPVIMIEIMDANLQAVSDVLAGYVRSGLGGIDYLFVPAQV